MKRVEFFTYLSKPQYQVYADDSRFILLIAGRRFGKTFLSAYKMRQWAKKPNSLFGYVAPSYRMAKGIFWAILLSIIPQSMIEACEKSSLIIKLINNAEIRLFGAQNYDSIRGLGFDGVIIDETKDVPREAWYEVIRPALSDRDGKALVIGTPRGRSDLLFDIYSSEHFKKYHFRTIDGGWVSQEEIEQAKRELDERTFKQEYEAEFVDETGMVYYAFSDENLTEYEPQKNLPIFLTWDFNVGERPMSCILLQEKDGKVYAFKEFVYFNSNTHYTAEAVGEYLRKEKFKGEIWVTGDYTGNAMKSSATKSDYEVILQTLRGFGFSPRLKIRPVKSIKNRVAMLNGLFCNTLGERRLFVDKQKCKRLIDDLRRVVWREDGVSLDDRNPERTHPSDALSYYAYNFSKSVIVDVI